MAGGQLEQFQQAVASLLQAQQVYRQEIEDRWKVLQVKTDNVQLELQRLAEGPKALLIEKGSGASASGHGSTAASVDLVSVGIDSVHCNGPAQEPSPVSQNHHNLRFLEASASPTSLKSMTEASYPLGDVPSHSTSMPVAKNYLQEITHSDVATCEEVVFQKVEEEERLREEIADSVETVKWKAFVKSGSFDMWMGLLILVNMVVIVLRVQYEGLKTKPSGGAEKIPELEALLSVTENMFAGFFLLELILRHIAVGKWYLYNRMNFLDAMVVFLSCLDSWFISSSDEGAFGISTLRVFRLLRLMKVLRLVRFMNAFRPLRVLVTAVSNSIGALLWSMILLFLFEIIAAIFFAQYLQMAITDMDRDLQSREYLWGAFGTMTRAWLTIFEITMAPGGFIAHRRLYDEVNPLCSLALTLYVCLVTFAVIRVITAMFLKETLAAADLDGKRDKDRMTELRRAYAAKLCKELEECRGVAPGKGRVNRDALDKLLNYNRMANWLRDMDLNSDDIDKLFQALVQWDGHVVLADFLACLTQVNRSNRGREVILQRESHKVLDLLSKVHARQQQKHANHQNGHELHAEVSSRDCWVPPPGTTFGQKWANVMPCGKGFLSRIVAST
mmetsp:Transcript_12356/g.24007  ORF Transcript_12356/g.24007 Transcript_12356/m.24007 type:complete len:616 (-) Transcript_12356:97-1944(-)